MVCSRLRDAPGRVSSTTRPVSIESCTDATIEPGAELLDRGRRGTSITSGKLWPVSTCITGNGSLRGPERLGRDVRHHDAVLAAARRAARGARIRPRPHAGGGSTRLRAQRGEKRSPHVIVSAARSEDRLDLGPAVQAALVLAAPGPATRTRVVAVGDRSGARPAADRRVALRRERVLEQLVVAACSRRCRRRSTARSG